MKLLFAACALAAFVVLWSGDAAAHPGYPLVVENTLGLPAIFDPSGNNGGCYLCHTSEQGMSPLRPFGTFLVENYGLSSDMVNEDDASLVAALKALEVGPDAHLVTDIKNGVDPNTDPIIANSGIPTPAYGCALTSGTGPERGERTGPWMLLVAVAATLIVRRGPGRGVALRS
jgi:hypothetical protein